MDYDAFLSRAVRVFNKKMNTDFSTGNLILTCFMTEDQVEIFEQFCTEYFPYRLEDRYQEDGYFDFRVASFIGIDNGGIDGILLRTDISYRPVELLHILLHALAHIYYVRNELEGKNYPNEYRIGHAATSGEAEFIHAGYAIWRECIAEIIAIKCDDNCGILPLGEKKAALAHLKGRIEPHNGKRIMSEILAAVMTSTEVEQSETWQDAEKAIQKLALFDTPPERKILEQIYSQLRSRPDSIDVNFVAEIGLLYRNIFSDAALPQPHPSISD